MKLHMLRSLTSITGASAQAPRHSLCCTVNSAVGGGSVQLDTEPAAQVVQRRLARRASWQGRLVQTLSLKRPTGCWLYML
jgi:hypothetical protein